MAFLMPTYQYFEVLKQLCFSKPKSRITRSGTENESFKLWI